MRQLHIACIGLLLACAGLTAAFTLPAVTAPAHAEGEPPTTAGATTTAPGESTSGSTTTTTVSTTVATQTSSSPPPPRDASEWHVVREPLTVPVPPAAQPQQTPTGSLTASSQAELPHPSPARSPVNKGKPFARARNVGTTRPDRARETGSVLAADRVVGSAGGAQTYASILILTTLALAIACFALVSVPNPYVPVRSAAWFVSERSTSMTAMGVVFLLVAAAVLLVATAR